MKNSLIALIVATTLGGSVSLVNAQNRGGAGQGRGFERPPIQDEGEIGPRRGGPRGGTPEDREGMLPPHPVIRALDVNADGVVSAEEIANAASALAALDTNRDGKLTRDELRPRVARRVAEMNGRGRGGQSGQGPEQGAPRRGRGGFADDQRGPQGRPNGPRGGQEGRFGPPQQ